MGVLLAKTIKLRDPAPTTPKRRPAAVLAAPTPEAPPETPAPDTAPGVVTLKLRDLLERVGERSGVKKKDTRAVVEATLAALGDALGKGEALNLPGLGRGRVNRQKDTAGGEVMIVKLKRPTPGVRVKKPKGPADAEGDTGLAGDDD